ncbi:hypothetical protein Trydic_g16837 [Trypoxylus dichotomus]
MNSSFACALPVEGEEPGCTFDTGVVSSPCGFNDKYARKSVATDSGYFGTSRRVRASGTDSGKRLREPTPGIRGEPLRVTAAVFSLSL